MSSTFSDRKPDKDEAETSAPKSYKAHPDWRDIKMPLAPISTWKESTKARVLPHDPALFRWILRVKYNAGMFIMQMPEPYLDLEATPDDIGRMYGPTFAKNSGYPSDMVGSVYSVQLVKIRADSEGVETNITAREHECAPTEYPLRAWNFERPNGGEIPKHVAEHLAWRKANEGRTVEEPDPDAAKDGDYRVEDVEFLDGEDGPPDARDRDVRGGRGRDRDPMNDRFPDDPRGPRDPFGGAVGGGYDAGGGYGPAAAGFPGASPRNAYGPAVAAPPPPRLANGHLWTGSPPGFNPPEPGEWKHCPTGRAEWVGNHYEPAPPLAPAGNVASAAEELPPVVNGLLRMANGSYVPIPHGATRLSAGNWIPNPDPNVPITNPARQLGSSAPPMPERSPEDPDYYEIDGAWVFAPHGIRFKDGAWQPKLPPPVPKREEKKESLVDSLASEKGVLVLGVLEKLATGIFGGRREDAAAERDRVREEARLATERAKAEADAAKENARVLAEAQKEAARLQADAQIKAAQLAAERDREARAADEARRAEQATLAREDRIREENRREEERKREHAILMQRAADELAERHRREDRERQERAAADARMEKMLDIARKPAALPVDPALEDLKRALNDAKREASKGGDFAAEFKKMRSLAEAMGAKFGDAAPGPTSDPDIVGPIVMSAVEKTFEFVDRYIKTRESAPRQPAAQPVAITQHPPRPMVPPYPPPAGHFWGFDPRTSQFIAVPMPTQPAPVQLPPVPAAPQFAQPSEAPDGVVTNGPAYVQPAAEQPPPAGESAWSVAEVPPAEEPPPAPVANEAPPPVF
jgi:hypothetical protein